MDEKVGARLLSFISVRLAILCITILLSFISLAKTGYNVNVPDPDENRKSKQTPSNVKRFWLTSLPFHFVCALFRVSCLAYFLANLSTWTTLIIIFTIIINMLILYFDAKASPTVTILLGVVSVFMPNGYLLHNFAASLPVNFSFEESRKFLGFHMLAVTAEFCIIVGIIWAGQALGWNFITENIPLDSVLNEDKVKYGFDVGLILLGALSLLLALTHWKRSIVPLYFDDNAENGQNQEETELEVKE